MDRHGGISGIDSSIAAAYLLKAFIDSFCASKEEMMKRFVSELVRLTLGIAYATAGCLKLFDVDSFLSDIKAFDIVPGMLVVPAALFIIGGEIFLGLALAARYRTKTMAALLALLTSLFSIGVLIVTVENRTVNCGCFGSMLPEQTGAGVLARDFFMIAACVWLSTQKGGAK